MLHMGLLEYFIDNYVMLYELIGLFAILGISTLLSSRMKRLTISIVVLLLLESVIYKLERWTQTLTHLSYFRPFFTATLYTMYPLILMLLILLTETDNFSRRSLVLTIPWLVSIPIYYSSQWTRLVCWYTQDNHYQGGLFPKLPYFVFGFYVLVFVVQNIRFFRSYSRMNRKISRYIIIGAIVGVLLYLVFEVEKDYSEIFTASILLYYVLVYIHMAKMDPLTQLPNRQSYYQDLKIDTNIITGVISADMNGLQSLNDNLGHEYGDMALMVVAGVLKHHCPARSTVYRVGGDEFMVLCRKLREPEIKAMIAAMRENLEHTSYVCAFGYAMCGSGVNVFDAIKLADSRMGEDKATLKQGSL